MADPAEKTNGRSATATTLIPAQGNPFANGACGPQAEGPAGPTTRKGVIVLPRRSEVAKSLVGRIPEKINEFPVPFMKTAEDFQELEKAPVRKMLGTLLGSSVVRIVAVAAPLAMAVYDVSTNKEISWGVYNFISQVWIELNSIAAGAFSIATGAFFGLAAATVAIGASLPFISNDDQEKAIQRGEVDEENRALAKARASERKMDVAHRVVRKLRQASFLGTLPLFSSDLWSQVTSGFHGLGNFVKNLSAPAQGLMAAFAGLTLVSIVTSIASSRAKAKIFLEEERAGVAGEKKEAAAAQTPEGKQAKAEAEAEAEAQRNFVKDNNDALENKDRIILGLHSELGQAIEAKLSLQQEREALLERIAAAGSASASPEELESLRAQLAEKEGAIQQMKDSVEGLQRNTDSLKAERDSLKEGKEALEEKFSKTEGSLKSMYEIVTEKNKELEAKGHEIAALNRQAEALRAEHDAKKKELDALRAQMESITDKEGRCIKGSYKDMMELWRKMGREDDRLTYLSGERYDVSTQLKAKQKELEMLQKEVASAKDERAGSLDEIYEGLYPEGEAPAPAPKAPRAKKATKARAPAQKPAQEAAAPQTPAPAPSPAAEPLRGSPEGFPATVSDAPVGEGAPEGYDPEGSAVAV